jgi:hypothetical protein
MCNSSTLRRKSKLTVRNRSDNEILIFLRYIFSSHIASCINFLDATLSLATCCIQYLCQKHHDTDMSDDELRDNVLSGAYRLHEYSATMWLELVERYVRFAKSATPPSHLIKPFQMLIEKRSSDEFSDDNKSTLLEIPTQHSFKWDSPDIHEILRNAAYFRNKCAEGEYDKRKG